MATEEYKNVTKEKTPGGFLTTFTVMTFLIAAAILVYLGLACGIKAACLFLMS